MPVDYLDTWECISIVQKLFKYQKLPMSPLVMPRTVLIPKIICQKFKCWKISKTQTLKGGNKCHKLCNDRFWLLNGRFSSVLLQKPLHITLLFLLQQSFIIFISQHPSCIRTVAIFRCKYARFRTSTNKNSDLLSNFWKLILISWKNRIEHAMSTS